MQDFSPPPGYQPYTRLSPLLEPWAPFWIKELSDRVLIGVLAREAHCNSRGLVHGGFFAAIADQAMGHTTGGHVLGLGMALQSLLTSSISIDYIASARIGQWLVFDTFFASGGRTLWFAELDISADGETVARGRASFRLLLEK